MYTKSEDSALIGAEESVTKNFIGKKEKWTNNGKDKYEDVRFSLIRYNESYPMFVQKFKILGAVVPEKSVTKSFTGKNEKMDK